MRFTHRTLLAAPFLVAGTAVSAAGFDVVEPYQVEPDYFRATLGYYLEHNYDAPIFDNELVGFYGDVEAERQYGNILAFGAVGFEHNDFFDGQFIELGAGYYVTPNVLVGAQLNYYHFSGSELDYSAFAQYEGANGAVALSYNIPEFGDNYVIVSGEYMFSPHTSVYGQWYHDDDDDFVTVNLGHSFGATKANIIIEADDDDYVGALLYLDHHLNDRTRIFGAVGAASDNGFDSSIVAIGGGYKVAENTWLEAAYGVYDNDATDGDIFTLNLTYQIGKSKRVEQRVNNSYRDIYDAVGYGLGF